MKNKNLKLLLLSGLLLINTTSCRHDPSKEGCTVICPSGTPALALANYFTAMDKENYQIVDGSDPLLAAFQNETDDFIIAPVNLGAKMYQANQHYVLYKTIVWGNLYIASLNEINSLNDLSGKTIKVNGANTTPDILVRSLLSMNNITDCTIEYVDSVNTCNNLLLSGQAQYVVSAEPSLSVIKTKKTVYTLDLQEAWKQATTFDSYPQAGIFVKNVENKVIYQKELLEMSRSVQSTVQLPQGTAENAITISKTFETIGVNNLTSSIPNCNFAIKDDEVEKTAIEGYFNKMAELGLSNQFGAKLPDEQFYYHF